MEGVPDLGATLQAVATLAQESGVPVEVVQETILRLQEVNPMIGFRGCRLGISYPELTEMQVRAIVEAACNVAAEGATCKPGGCRAAPLPLHLCWACEGSCVGCPDGCVDMTFAPRAASRATAFPRHAPLQLGAGGKGQSRLEGGLVPTLPHSSSLALVQR